MTTHKKKIIKKKGKPKAKRSQKKEFIKMVSGLGFLVLMIALAGFIIHHLLPGNLPAALIPEQNVYQNPVYEIYPEDTKQDTKPVYKIVTKHISKPKSVTVSNLPRVAIIVDDIGYDQIMAEKFLDLDVVVTFSMLPFSPFQRKIVETAHRKGIETMLHIPMEPNEYPKIALGPGGLLTSMSPNKLIDQLNKALDDVSYIKGVNNHMGSKMTTNSEQMNQVFSVLKKRGLFFIDSRTSQHTLCESSARLFQVPFSKRDVFIDHIQDPEFIRNQLKELVRIAKQNGEAVGICHPHPETLEALRNAIPELKKKIFLVPASEIVNTIG
jgi:polysaccharide deacetylase 2 family uncharacterized protein YibQ